jgi:ParB family chromosome partitioning protein
MVKRQCLFGTLLTTKVPGRHFLYPESWRKGVKMTEPNRQPGEKEERIIEIEIERLRPFKEHPFQVKDDKEMFLLQESIEKYGILNPLIVRPVPDVLHCMRGNTTKVKNIKKYLLAALFNAPSTMNGYY